MIALGRPVRGMDFPVVWVCSEEDFSDDERGLPWPLDAVRVLESA